jgi:CO/xanthine dehydrogenase FAD-binding subunit
MQHRAPSPSAPSIGAVDVLTPRTVQEALELKAAHPEARFIQGGTDVMVELNFAHSRPPAIVNLAELEELRGWSEEDQRLRLGAGLTYTEAMASPLSERLPALAEASRTVGSPQIRNRGTIGGNLGTASPAGDALPPLLVDRADVEIASVRGVRTLPLEEFLLGVKRTALEPDELITSVRVAPCGGAQTFMKVGPRNAMVIAVCSLAVVVDTEAGEVRAAFGSAAVTARLVTVPLADAATLPDRVAESASPIDDVRGSAVYRRHVLRVLAARALERCLRS